MPFSNKRTSNARKSNMPTMTIPDSDDIPATPTTNHMNPSELGNDIEEIPTDTSITLPGDSSTNSIIVDVEAESEAASKKRKLTSKVWDHFERIKDGSDIKAICNYCKSTLSAMSASGTNHLQRHYKKCFTEHGGITTEGQTQLMFRGNAGGVWIFSQDETHSPA
ncbi:hypothetical protein MJO29_004725 [Puccinia striiformis f. sp. tritici]|nr:hypothetical protein MJO29_004725 [Puccinia striiformis f. sp. tritici]